MGLGIGSTRIPVSSIPFSGGAPDQYLYGSSNSGRFYRINQADGSIVEDIGALGFNPHGLGESEGVVYAHRRESGFYSVNLETGNASRISWIGGRSSSTFGLAGLNGVLYLIRSRANDNRSELLSVNVTTGATTLVVDFTMNTRIQSLGGLGGVLYGRSSTEHLFSNFQPGSTLVDVGSLELGIEGLAGLGSTLYGIRRISGSSSQLYSINTSSGAVTSLGTNAVGINSLAGLDAGVASSARIHIIPSKRVDVWRPTGTTNQLGFYSARSTTVLEVVGIV